jgi:hypothetical protein
MPRSVYKYTLSRDHREIEMPMGARLLMVGVQDHCIRLWAEVVPVNPMETREFAIYGTGHEMPGDPGAYVGSCILLGGELVFHIYETTKDPT